MIETKTTENIHREILSMMSDEVGYIDALVEYAHNHKMEIEALGVIIRRSIVLKEHIRQEAMGLKLVEKDEKTSIFDHV